MPHAKIKYDFYLCFVKTILANIQNAILLRFNNVLFFNTGYYRNNLILIFKLNKKITKSKL